MPPMPPTRFGELCPALPARAGKIKPGDEAREATARRSRSTRRASRPRRWLCFRQARRGDRRHVRDRRPPDRRGARRRRRHPAETAKLHAGDFENRVLWDQFMPHCMAAIQEIYDRLDIKHDVHLGESFYDPMLKDVVADLEERRGWPSRARGPLGRSTTRGSTPAHDPEVATEPTTTAPPTWPRSNIADDEWNADLLCSTSSTTARATTSSRSSPRRGSGATPMSSSTTSPSARSSAPTSGRYKTRDGDVVGLESLLDEAVAPPAR